MGFHKVPNLLVAGTLGVGGLVGWFIKRRCQLPRSCMWNAELKRLGIPPLSSHLNKVVKSKGILIQNGRKNAFFFWGQKPFEQVFRGWNPLA